MDRTDSKKQKKIFLFKNKPEHKILKLLEEKKGDCFYIPPIQRLYVWKIQDINILLDDIDAGVKDNENLWLGVLLIKKLIDGEPIEIIDGQQRILTLMIIWREYAKALNLELPQWKINVVNDEDRLLERLYKNDKTSYYDILEYLLNQHCESKKSDLKKIIESIRNWLIMRKDDSFKQFLLNNITVTILETDKHEYQLFENLNSKGVKLTLIDKCYAYLYETIKYNQWTQDIDKIDLIAYLRDHTFNLKILELFIRLYSNIDENYPRGDTQLFICFKQIMSRKNETESLFKFLKLYKTITTIDSNVSEVFAKNWYYKSFYFIYLLNFCWSEFYVIFYAVVAFHPTLIEYFLKNFWKVDFFLILGYHQIKGLAEGNYRKAWYIKNHNLKNAKKCLKRFFTELIGKGKKGYKSGEATFDTENYKTISKLNSKNERIKAIYWLLFNSCAEMDINEFEKTLQGSSFRDFTEGNIHLDHVIPTNPRDDIKKKNYTEEQLNLCQNLILLTRVANQKLGNQSFWDKMMKIKKHKDYMPIGEQYVMIMQIFDNKDFKQQRNKAHIAKFWKEHIEKQCKHFKKGLQNKLTLKIDHQYLEKWSGEKHKKTISKYLFKKENNEHEYFMKNFKTIKKLGKFTKGIKISSKELAYLVKTINEKVIKWLYLV